MVASPNVTCPCTDHIRDENTLEIEAACYYGWTCKCFVLSPTVHKATIVVMCYYPILSECGDWSYLCVWYYQETRDERGGLCANFELYHQTTLGDTLLLHFTSLFTSRSLQCPKAFECILRR